MRWFRFRVRSDGGITIGAAHWGEGESGLRTLFLRRGHWVEVYDDDTKELLAGTFDPDQAAPAYIV